MLIMKLSCLLLYALGFASWAGFLPYGSAHLLEVIALVVLSAHALETVIAFNYVRRYRGGLAMSVFLTLLFGLLHVIPLVREKRVIIR